ncbi:hypothetical protein ACQ4PT_053210 [Festuca glaucescens]
MAVAAMLLLMLVVAPASAQRQQPPVARPGCRDKCGNITVPYPFGIGAGCYRVDGQGGYALECDDSGSSPPRLTVEGYSHRLAALSLAAGEARAYLNATRECFNSTGGLVGGRSRDTSMALVFSVYRFSDAKNRLVALGCPNLGYFVDAARYYVSGCMSVCRPSQYAMPGPCTGVGCCQSAIPPGIDFFEPHQRNFPKGQDDSDSVFLDRADDFDVPVVLDWAVRNVGNCSAARRNATDFACRSTRSECFDSTNGPGYRCNCSTGFHGNPYLDGGCTDIDECQLKDDYPCHGVCTNTLGNYTCQCHPETSGDPTVKNGCRPNDKFTLALKVLTGVGAGVILLGSMCCCLCLTLQKSKLMRTKEKFFEHNGGVILQQQMRSYNGTISGATGGFKIFSSQELKKAWTQS